ncbi:MAG: hypothetical protein HYX53_14235 [Chloroflexi bacterium]|nr:hypothetical protein [Chloroflexota bacterium]
MRMKRLLPIAAIAAAILVAVPVASVLGDTLGSSPADETASAVLGNGFTYQGRLTESGAPANGTYDLRFILYDAETGGAQVGTEVEQKDDVTVTNGIFNVVLTFSATAFNGDARWLEIAVRAGSGTGTAGFTVLSPRQPVSPAPYALFAKAAKAVTLPFAATAADAGAILDISNTGAGTAAKFTAGTGLAALEVSGAVKVSGTNPAALVVTPVLSGLTQNVCATGTAAGTGLIIRNALTDGDANAILLVTPQSTAATPALPSAPFVLKYAPDASICSGAGSNWVILAADTLAVTDKFNVLVIKQ